MSFISLADVIMARLRMLDQCLPESKPFLQPADKDCMAFEKQRDVSVMILRCRCTLNAPASRVLVTRVMWARHHALMYVVAVESQAANASQLFKV